MKHRIYRVNWFMHEYMHHLYQVLFPELNLENPLHSWFDLGTWPGDFVGRYEQDYLMESVNKRLQDYPDLPTRIKASALW